MFKVWVEAPNISCSHYNFTAAKFFFFSSLAHPCNILLLCLKKCLLSASKCFCQCWRGEGPHGPEIFQCKAIHLTESNVLEVVLMQHPLVHRLLFTRCDSVGCIYNYFEYWRREEGVADRRVAAVAHVEDRKQCLQRHRGGEVISRSSRLAARRDGRAGGVTAALNKLPNSHCKHCFWISALLPNWEFVTKQWRYISCAESL